MNKKVFRKIQFLSNISIIVVAVFLTALIVKELTFSADKTGNNEQNLQPIIEGSESAKINSIRKNPLENVVGKLLPLENANWSQGKKNVVLYVSNTCHYCSESAPFYQRLVSEGNKKGIQFTAVMPQPVDQGRAYLEKLGVSIENIYQDKLDKIGIRGTPTLMIVDNQGIIKNVWLGKLSVEREAEVLNTL